MSESILPRIKAKIALRVKGLIIIIGYLFLYIVTYYVGTIYIIYTISILYTYTYIHTYNIYVYI